jgi:hemerythrin-like domain-containing protein
MKPLKITTAVANAKHKVDDPFDMFRKEHEEILAYLKQMDKAAEVIRDHGFSSDAFEQIATGCRFINAKIRQHEENEEKYLFPLLDRHANSSQPAMRIEHRELCRTAALLLETVEDLEKGKIYPTTIGELVQTSKSLVVMLNSHIEKENEVLFPMAMRLLTGEEYKQLKKNMTRAKRGNVVYDHAGKNNG